MGACFFDKYYAVQATVSYFTTYLQHHELLTKIISGIFLFLQSINLVFEKREGPKYLCKI
jgi:hypothetical protein